MRNAKIISARFFSAVAAFVFLFFSAFSAYARSSASVGIAGVDFRPGEVLSTANSYEHAQRIAAAHNLRLFSFAHGIAVFGVQNPVAAVAQSAEMRQGMRVADDIPELSLNAVFRPQNPGPDTAGVRQQWHHTAINTERAWTVSTGAGVTVAVIDTGIDTTHPALRDRISPRSFNSHSLRVGIRYVQDDDGHGTLVAGIIAAQSGRGTAAGVAPGVELLVIKANAPGIGYFEQASWLRGVNYAVENGAHIINLSLGRHHLNGPDPNEQRVLRNAVNSGVVVIAAAGNDGFGRAGFPAANPEVIAVSAVREPGIFDSSFSNFGPEIAIAAPGSLIYSTLPVGRTGSKNGTSMAAPVVAGVAALVLSRDGSLTPREVREILTGSTRRTSAWNRNLYGYGIVNAYAAVSHSRLPPPPLPALTGTVSISGTAQVGQTLTANVAGLGGSGAVSFQWRRGNANVGAGGGTLTLTAADAGQQMAVVVTRTGNSGNISSTWTAVVAAAPPPQPAPGGMVRVEGGTMWMQGRNVTLTTFNIGRHLVTQGEWFDVMGTRPSWFTGANWRNLPVEQVSWWDAIEFANAKSRRASLTPAYTISGTGANRIVTWNRGANGYRLPTEAEWECVDKARKTAIMTTKCPASTLGMIS